MILPYFLISDFKIVTAARQKNDLGNIPITDLNQVQGKKL